MGDRSTCTCSKSPSSVDQSGRRSRRFELRPSLFFEEVWSNASRTAAKNRLLSKGLRKKANAPACFTVVSAARSSRPVMKITRVLGDLAHKWASNTIPVILFIQMSKTATGTKCVAKCSRNASGSLNALTLNPEDSSNRVTDFRTDGSSSTRQTTGETSGTLPL